MSNKLNCPACNLSDSLPLEMVETSHQHHMYLPNSKAIQEQLNNSLTVREYQMQQCSNCGLEFANPLHSPSANWYSLLYENLNLYVKHRWEFDFVVQSCPPDKSIYEFGCGSGQFLKLCQKSGLDCYGFDFSETAVDDCLSTGLNASLFNLNSDEALLSYHSKRSVFAAFHVLEHLENPGWLFNIANLLSTPQATLWIAVPSLNRPSRYYRKVDPLDQPPHHLTRWTYHAFENIGSRYGWQLSKLHFSPITMPTRLWWYTRETAVYRWICDNIASRGTERLIRYFIYPIAFIQDFKIRNLITGDSMLAEFTKT
ncbi:MAG: methyltransferase domain-containing protein [Cyanobacteriota bacterium]|nr:methyltransferase domain-containing protein [Cyanobacteriota bacterium]